MKLIVAIVFFIEPVDDEIEKMLREKVMGKQSPVEKRSKQEVSSSRVSKKSSNKKKQIKG